jgi:Fe-S oxidoreductase
MSVVPEARDERLEASKNEMIVCSLCGICVPECPTFNATKLEGFAPRGRIALQELLMRGRAKTSQDYVDRIFSCATCKRCNQVCPAKVEQFEMNERARANLVRKGVAPPQAWVPMTENIAKMGNPQGMSPKSRNELFQGVLQKSHDPHNPHVKSDTLFFIGCTYTFRTQNVPRVTAKILEALDYPFMLLGEEEPCCADPFYIVGMRDNFERTAKKNAALFKEHGVKRIVTICPLCTKSFRENYPSYLGSKDFEVVHISELLSKLIREGRVKFKEKVPLNVMYHDPCHLGRHLEVFEPPRDVLRSIPGLKFTDLEGYSKELAWCCGGAIRAGYPNIAVKVSDGIIENARKVGADTIATTCPMCMHSIMVASNFELKVYDLAELTAAAMGIQKLGSGLIE